MSTSFEELLRSKAVCGIQLARTITLRIAHFECTMRDGLHLSRPQFLERVVPERDLLLMKPWRLADALWAPIRSLPQGFGS